MKKSELPVGSVIKLMPHETLCVKFQDSGDPGRDFRYVSTGHVCEYDSMHRAQWDLVSAPGAKLTDDAYFSDPRVQMLAEELTKTQAAFNALRGGKFETALNETATPASVLGPLDVQALLADAKPFDPSQTGIPGITDEEVEAFNAALQEGRDQAVWVLHIDHQHGTDTSVFTTERAARKALHRWVTQYWYDNGPGDIRNIPMPDDFDERIKVYREFFSDYGGEWYSLERYIPQDEPQEVIREAAEITDPCAGCVDDIDAPDCTACGASNAGSREHPHLCESCQP